MVFACQTPLWAFHVENSILYKDAADEQVTSLEEQNIEIEVKPCCVPLKTENTDFEIFLTAIVDAATQSGKQAMLSQALLCCLDHLTDEQKEEYYKDLERKMPEFFEIIRMYFVEM